MSTGKKYIARAVTVLFMFVLLAGMLTGGQTNVRAAGKMALSSTKMTLRIGQSKKLTVSNANAKKVTWKSSKKAVANVNKNGKVTAKKAGKTTIAAEVSGKKLTCRVTVKKAAADNPAETTPTEPSETTPEEPSEKDGKLLVAYFSWSGTSERIAHNIIAQTGADSFRIEREIPYSSNYSEVAYGEAKTETDTNARPPIKNPPASLEAYDRIILCYPIWWHTAPMTVGTFLESYDLSGKYIYPVSQSASMDRGQFEESVTFIRGCAKGAFVDDGLFTKDSGVIQAYVNGIINSAGK